MQATFVLALASMRPTILAGKALKTSRFVVCWLGATSSPATAATRARKSAMTSILCVLVRRYTSLVCLLSATSSPSKGATKARKGATSSLCVRAGITRNDASSPPRHSPAATSLSPCLLIFWLSHHFLFLILFFSFCTGPSLRRPRIPLICKWNVLCRAFIREYYCLDSAV